MPLPPPLFLHKNKLVAAQPRAAALQFGQPEAALLVKVENLFGRRILVRVTADPIHDVPPTGHAAKFVRLDPRAQICAGTAVERGAYKSLRFVRSHDQQRERRSQPARQIVVSLFDPRPATALAAAVIVDCDEKPAPGRVGQTRVLQRLPHLSGVMQHSPGVDDVELPEPGQIIGVEDRAFLDDPLRVARKIALSQLYGAGDRLRVVIKRNYARAQSPGRQTEQPAARPDVQKTQSRERINLQHSFERRFGCDDLLLPNAFQKAAPVLAELETFAARDLIGAPVGRVFVESLVHFLSSKNPWARDPPRRNCCYSAK